MSVAVSTCSLINWFSFHSVLLIFRHSSQWFLKMTVCCHNWIWCRQANEFSFLRKHMFISLECLYWKCWYSSHTCTWWVQCFRIEKKEAKSVRIKRRFIKASALYFKKRFLAGATYKILVCMIWKQNNSGCVSSAQNKPQTALFITGRSQSASRFL